MQKKGFGTNQLFVLSISVIILGLVLYFGMQAVGAFKRHACDIEIADMVSSLRANIKEVSQDVGQRKKIELALPCDATDVCIADYDSPDVNAVSQHLRNRFSVLLSDDYDSRTANLYLIKGKVAIQSFDVQPVSIPGSSTGTPQGLICFNSPSEELRLEGSQRKAQITLW